MLLFGGYLAEFSPHSDETHIFVIIGVSAFTSRLCGLVEVAEAPKWTYTVFVFLLHAHIISLGLNYVSFRWQCLVEAFS